MTGGLSPLLHAPREYGPAQPCSGVGLGFGGPWRGHAWGLGPHRWIQGIVILVKTAGGLVEGPGCRRDVVVIGEAVRGC